jgi:hypothetical protein
MGYAKIVSICDALDEQRSSESTRAVCYVYVIRDPVGECCKVGIATDPTQRLATLTVGNPRLKISGTEEYHDGVDQYLGHPMALVEQAREVEKIAHALLSDWRLSGEWFAVDADLAHRAIRSAVRVVQSFRDARDSIFFDIQERKHPHSVSHWEACDECSERLKADDPDVIVKCVSCGAEVSRWYFCTTDGCGIPKTASQAEQR